MKLRLFNPEKRIAKQLGKFLRDYPIGRLQQDGEAADLGALSRLNEQEGELYFPDFFKHMVVAIWKKLSARSGQQGKGVFEAAMIIAFEFLKRYGYVNRGSVMRNIRLTNRGSRRNIYHANGECSASRGEAMRKSTAFDSLFRQYFRKGPLPRSAPTIGQPQGISPGLAESAGGA